MTAVQAASAKANTAATWHALASAEVVSPDRGVCQGAAREWRCDRGRSNLRRADAFPRRDDDVCCIYSRSLAIGDCNRRSSDQPQGCWYGRFRRNACRKLDRHLLRPDALRYVSEVTRTHKNTFRSFAAKSLIRRRSCRLARAIGFTASRHRMLNQ